MRFIQLTHSKANTETLKSTVEKRLIHKAADQGGRKANLRFLSPKIRVRAIYGKKRQGGLRCGERWLEVKKVR